MTNKNKAEAAAAVAADDQPRSSVVHNYIDHATEQMDDSGLLELSSEGKRAQATDRNFPVKLHYMLSELENDNQDHIVSWAPHGRCFVVHDQVCALFRISSRFMLLLLIFSNITPLLMFVLRRSLFVLFFPCELNFCLRKGEHICSSESTASL